MTSIDDGNKATTVATTTETIPVHLAYGTDGLDVRLPHHAQVLRTKYVAGVPDEATAIRHALRNPIGASPLRELVSARSTVVIVHSDITRPTPNDRMLPVILEELALAGVQREQVTLINGLGTHRRQTDAELREMLGDYIVDNYRCTQHDAFDDSNLVPLGETRMGHPVRINKCYLEADVRILTGFIEPHFFAGFSGGPKAVLPALAGAESVLTNHGSQPIGHPSATWGITTGNPIWEEMREVALRTNPHFLVNVTLNADKQITGVFAGELLAAHALGCEFVRSTAMVAVEQEYDIVVTTNSGYPLDQNLYQCVKGMSAAAKIVCQGGVIVMAGECRDGLPNHGQYSALLAQGRTPDGVLELVHQPGFAAQDQWQVQIQALVQKRATVYVFSDGLTADQIWSALFQPCQDIECLVSQLVRQNGYLSSIAVLPEGPQTVPYLVGGN